MNRLARFFTPRMVVPLAVIVTAGLPWLIPLTRTPPAGNELHLAIAAPSAGPACAEASPPALLALGESVRPLDVTAMSAIHPTIYPYSPAPAQTIGPLTTNGPQLTPPLPALVMPPDRTAASATPAARANTTPSMPVQTLASSAGRPPIVGRPPITIRPTPSRSPLLENMARQADRQIVYGFELANRQAFFAARAEFVAALRLVAQALDTEGQSSAHSRSLSAGLTALSEAKDFVPTGSKLEADLDLRTIIAGHRTPILQKTPVESLQAMSAMKCYFTFAQEQLAQAAGHEVAGSMSLYALGKLHATMAREKKTEIPAAEPKAVAFYQAALIVYPGNHMASNDLGVFFARCGAYAQARQALAHSALLQRDATVLDNLATVCQQLGDAQTAAKARSEAVAARRVEIARQKARQMSAGGMIQWVDPTALAQTGDVSTDMPKAASPSSGGKATSPAVNGQPVAPPSESSGTKKALLGWLPWSQEKTTTR